MKFRKGLLIFTLILILVVQFSVLALAAKEFKITFSTHQPGGFIEETAMEYFKELIEERSNGGITVETFYGGVLGDERDQNDLVSVGEVQLSITGNVIGSSAAPEYMAMDVPYVISSEENLFKVWEGSIGKEINNILERDRRISILGVQRRGARSLTTKDRKGIYPEDLKGMKLRLPEVKEWMVVWEEIGTIPVPVASSEVFTALQLGTVEAQENPISSAYMRSLWEVQDYIVLTEHLHNYWLYIANTDWLESLDSDDRQLIEETLKDTLTYVNELDRANEIGMLAEMQEKGITVIIPDKDAYRKAALPAMRSLAENWAPGVYEEIVRIEGQDIFK